ncbi:MAG: hypothetical protein ACFE0Q_20830 [Anaerolineae bacterium]
MTFSYGYDLANDDNDRVRYEVGDTDPDGFFLHDEEITGLLALDGATWQTASLAAIRGIIGKLSRPSFTADWLRVDPKVALDSYRKLLAEKQDEYGLDLGESMAWFDDTSVDVTRSDVSDYTPRYIDDETYPR